MERAGVLISFFLILVAGVLGFTIATMIQSGDSNDSLGEDAFFKDCNFKTSEGCGQNHLYLAGFFIVFSIIGIFILNRNSSSIITPILIYYFSLMVGFGLRFII